ncbi:MAG: riboflavin synthase [Desulfobacterales bacterium]
MFTGIIEGLGTLTAKRSATQGSRLEIRADFPLEGSRTGDSIAVNGACLTAVTVSGSRFAADVSPETLASTAFNRLGVGQRVNLERALRLSDRLDGHLVSGHVDGVGTVKTITPAGNATVMIVKVPGKLAAEMVRKGSVAVDGISLTINRCDRQSFEVSIIPHTAKITTMGLWRPGHLVNIETDLIGKYVKQFIRTPPENRHSPSWTPDLGKDLLARKGFL